MISWLFPLVATDKLAGPISRYFDRCAYKAFPEIRVSEPLSMIAYLREEPDEKAPCCSYTNCASEATSIHTVTSLWGACTSSFKQALVVAKVIKKKWLRTQNQKGTFVSHYERRIERKGKVAFRLLLSSFGHDRLFVSIDSEERDALA